MSLFESSRNRNNIELWSIEIYDLDFTNLKFAFQVLFERCERIESNFPQKNEFVLTNFSKNLKKVI